MAAIRHIRLWAFAVILTVAACAPVYRNHGYVPPEQDLAMVVVGETTMDALPTLIGRPSAQGLLTGSSWYYVGSRWKHYGAYPPEEIEREVVAISFTDTGVVSNVERFGQERGRIVVLSQRVTDGGVASVSIITQLLRNLGNFSADQIID